MRKIGPHVLIDLQRMPEAPTVKVVDPSLPYVEELKREFPNIPIFVRFTHKKQPIDDPEETARSTVNKYESFIGACRGSNVIFEIGYNELDRSLIGDQSRMDMALMEYANRLNFRLGYGQFGVGKPEPEDWAQHYDPPKYAGEKHVLTLHEYHADREDLNNLWHIGRWILGPQWLRSVTKAVTECGRDYLGDLAGWGRYPGHPGWKLSGISLEAYVEEIRELDEIYQTDPSVIAAHLFTLGRILDPKWVPYDANALASVLWPAHNAPLVPTPTPEIPPEELREEVPEASFPLLNINKAWYEATYVYGSYDGHPLYCEDMNLESGGDTDYGEPVIAPINGFISFAGDFGGKVGKVVAVTGRVRDVIVTWRFKHLSQIVPSVGKIVSKGETIAAIGNSGGIYSAHLHMETAIGNIPPPELHAGLYMLAHGDTGLYHFVRPTEWLIEHGADRALVERMRKYK